MWFYAALPKDYQDTEPNHGGRSGERTSLVPPHLSHQTTVTNTSLSVTCRSVPKTFKSKRHDLSRYFSCMGKFKGLLTDEARGRKAVVMQEALVVMAVEMPQQPMGGQVGLLVRSGCPGRCICTTKTTRSG